MKGIIIASFGSIYQDAVEKSIGSIEKKVRSMYSDMEVRRVFLSDALVEKWNEKYEDKISSFTEAMQDFARMGIDEVYIQPITLVADQCYQQMRKQALKFLHSNEYGFSQVNIGKPLLTSLGVKNYADDYEATLESIVRHVNTKSLNKSCCAHGEWPKSIRVQYIAIKGDVWCSTKHSSIYYKWLPYF